MQTSGLVLDVYDDVHGDVLRGLFPSLDAVPDLLKTAQVVTPVEHDRLPDDAFALVLVNGDDRLRKYACIDAGNTALSVFYFLENAHKLPDEAQKTAARNLVTACGWYDLAVPAPLEKAAGVISGAARTLGEIAKAPVQGASLMTRPLKTIAKHPVQSAVTGLTAAPLLDKARNDAAANLRKIGELSGTTVMPCSKNPSSKISATATGTVVKTGAHLNPVVDVTELERAPKVTVKQARHYALPLERKYPLDSYENVKQAAAYFDEFGKRFEPEVRREYCVNLVKRAEDLNVEVSQDIEHYGSLKLASAEHFETAISGRLGLLEGAPLLREVLQKIAAQREYVAPGELCSALSDFDKLAGLQHHYDSDVSDPFFSVFGKTAEVDFTDWEGNERVSGEELKRFALAARRQIEGTFGEDFADEFQKDPIAIFKSLPREQKKMLRRMATDNSPGTPGI